MTFSFNFGNGNVNLAPPATLVSFHFEKKNKTALCIERLLELLGNFYRTATILMSTYHHKIISSS